MKNNIKTFFTGLVFLILGIYLYASTDKYIQAISSPGPVDEAAGFFNLFMPIVPYFGLLGLGILFIIDLTYVAYLFAWLLTRNSKRRNSSRNNILRLP